MIIWYNFWGPAPPPKEKNIGRAKPSTIRSDFGQLQNYIANVSERATRNGSSRWTYVLLLMFFFNARSPSSVGRSPRNFANSSKVLLFYNLRPKIWGTLPQKQLGAKNVQNLGRFRTTSKSDRQYLRIE